MNTYKSDTKDFILINLHKLIIDKNIVDMVNNQNVVFPIELVNNIKKCGTFPLNLERLNNIFKGFNKNLPPITVELRGNKYNVLNGRHRICASIVRGCTYIPCKVI